MLLLCGLGTERNNDIGSKASQYSGNGSSLSSCGTWVYGCNVYIVRGGMIE